MTNIEIGLITPPAGLNLDVLSSISPDIQLSAILVGTVPLCFLHAARHRAAHSRIAQLHLHPTDAMRR